MRIRSRRSGRAGAARSTRPARAWTGSGLVGTPFVPEVRLHLAEDAIVWWARMEAAAGHALPAPYWASAWAGGQALARHLLDHPELAAGRRVLDLAAGSGLVAIAAALAGADEVVANDIDPYAVAAVTLNARANRVRRRRAAATTCSTRPATTPTCWSPATSSTTRRHGRPGAAVPAAGAAARRARCWSATRAGATCRRTGWNVVADYPVPTTEPAVDSSVRQVQVLRPALTAQGRPRVGCRGPLGATTRCAGAPPDIAYAHDEWLAPVGELPTLLLMGLLGLVMLLDAVPLSGVLVPGDAAVLAAVGVGRPAGGRAHLRGGGRRLRGRLVAELPRRPALRRAAAATAGSAAGSASPAGPRPRRCCTAAADGWCWSPRSCRSSTRCCRWRPAGCGCRTGGSSRARRPAATAWAGLYVALGRPRGRWPACCPAALNRVLTMAVGLLLAGPVLLVTRRRLRAVTG